MRGRFPSVLIRDVAQPTATRNPTARPNEVISYVDIASVSNKGFKIHSPKNLLGRDAPSRARKVIRKNDVLIATTRPYLRTVALVPDAFDNQICSTGFCVLRSNESALPDWLFYFCLSDQFMQQIVPLMRGANYPAVTDKDILNAQIPVPPLSEQRRIVERIKECMERLEEMEKIRVDLEPERQALPRSYFNETYVRLAGCFPCKPLSEAGKICGGGTPSKQNAAFWKGEIPWVSPKDMKKRRLSGASLHISTSALSASAAKLIPAESVLFVVRGMILIHTLPIAINDVPVAINQDMKAILPSADMDANFLAAMLRGLERHLLSKVEVAGHGTRRLQTMHWASLPIPVPSLAEQQKVVQEINDVEAALQQMTPPPSSELLHVREAILRKAFAGDL
jgi:type I restriction enzyme S subunit